MEEQTWVKVTNMDYVHLCHASGCTSFWLSGHVPGGVNRYTPEGEPVHMILEVDPRELE